MFVIGLAPVYLGVAFGFNCIKPCEDTLETGAKGQDHLSVFTQSAVQYIRIAKHGYSYDPQRRSDVAYFPVYPLSARVVSHLTGWDVSIALFSVSLAALFSSFVLLSRIAELRYPVDSAMSGLIGGAFCFYPGGLFLRMLYSESTFTFVTLLFLFGVLRGWRISALALTAGLGTAVRPVGLALTIAFIWHASRTGNRVSSWSRMRVAILYLPVASWGVIAYMTYQYFAFGDPFSFIQTQRHWQYACTNDCVGDKALSLLLAEPVWAPYTSDGIRRWAYIDRNANPLFSIVFWNPICFAGAVGLVLLGAYRSWLTGTETVLGLGLLAIPYVTKAYENAMLSHARFSSVVIPAYIVAGHLLRAMPPWLAWSLLAVSGSLLTCWSALFAAGYPFF
jgi:hypothetical protein